MQYLLAHNYLLTALELLIEAQEAGDEDDVESLQHFFNDQAKFPAEEVAKFDPNEGYLLLQIAPKATPLDMACKKLNTAHNMPNSPMQQLTFSSWPASVKRDWECLNTSSELQRRT